MTADASLDLDRSANGPPRNGPDSILDGIDNCHTVHHADPFQIWIPPHLSEGCAQNQGTIGLHPKSLAESLLERPPLRALGRSGRLSRAR